MCAWTQDYGNEVRGCHGTAPIDDDEVIIEIPLQCLITVEMGKNTDVRRSFHCAILVTYNTCVIICTM